MDDARLVDLLKMGLEHVARHEDAYYNDDAQLGEAIRAAVFTKSGLLITAALAQPTVLQGAEKLHLALSGKEPFHLVGDKRIHLFKKGLGDGGMHLLAVVVLASTALQVSAHTKITLRRVRTMPYSQLAYRMAHTKFATACMYMYTHCIATCVAGAAAPGEWFHSRRRWLAC